jgi:transcriptional regulator with XRE-family HTH domain
VGLCRERLSEVLDNLLEESGVSCYKISNYTGIDEAYLSRLRNGEKHNPSLEVLIKIALALAYFSSKISIHDIEELLNSTGRTLNVKD